MKFRAGSLISAAFLLFLQPMAAQVGGTGTTNRIPVWTGSTTLGNSALFQVSGNVGLGNTSPTAILDVKGKPGTNGINSGNAPTALKVLGGLGAPSGTASGAGGPIQATSGTGATFAFPGGFPNARGGSGAIFLMTGGTGATCVFNGSRCTPTGGNGGSISLQPGSGGRFGNITLAPTGGKVGVGTSNPSATLEVGVGHTTLADSWVTRSSRRFKTNVQPLAGALEKVEQLQGVSYERKADGKHEIGVVAEDVDQVVPELVSLDPETKEVQSVDYARLTALLIEAVKSQGAEIQQLRKQVSKLSSNRPGN